MIPVGHRISPDATRSLRIVRVHDLSVPGNLSRVSWKLSRTVLRGGTRRKVGPLLDKRTSSKEKQPYQIQMADSSSFAFAGLWERWRAPDNEIIETCTILTTKPNALVSEVHDRMPVIVAADDYDLWLDPGIKDPTHVAGCLRPFNANLMKKYAVSTRVNRPGNDDEECAREVPVEQPAPLLF